MTRRTYGSHTVELSNEEKVLFPESGITKGDLIHYYEEIAEVILPHLDARPLTMQRFPDGIEEEGFYQKEAPEYFPSWIERVRVDKREGGSQEQVIAHEQATLVYLANQACITPHVWLSRRDDLERPDRLVVDLDPPGEDFGPVRRAARLTRDLFEEVGLVPFLMLTGSRGAHVWTPIRRGPDFDETRSFARSLATRLAEAHPNELTHEVRKEKRGARLFLDIARNAYAQTAVAPYAVRARPGAPVATPLDWDELDQADLASDRYDLRSVLRRLAQKEDPWKGIDRHAVELEAAEEALQRKTGPIED